MARKWMTMAALGCLLAAVSAGALVDLTNPLRVSFGGETRSGASWATMGLDGLPRMPTHTTQ
jgi:hypothetical protein